MEPEEEFMSLTKAAFSKIKKKVKHFDKRFSKEMEPGEESPWFLVTCCVNQDVFSVGNQGFWFISLLQAGDHIS